MSGINRYEQLMANKPFTWLRQSQFLLALIIYTTLLLVPNPQLAGPDISNAVLHALGNCLLMLSTWLASGGRYRAMGPFLFVIPFSLIIELAQGLTDNRTPEMVDVMANFGGAMIGYMACGVCNAIIDKMRNRPSM